MIPCYHAEFNSLRRLILIRCLRWFTYRKNFHTTPPEDQRFTPRPLCQTVNHAATQRNPHPYPQTSYNLHRTKSIVHLPVVVLDAKQISHKSPNTPHFFTWWGPFQLPLAPLARVPATVLTMPIPRGGAARTPRTYKSRTAARLLLLLLSAALIPFESSRGNHGVLGNICSRARWV